MAEGYEILSKNLIPNFDYYGFDYSEKMVEIARNRKPALKIEWNDVTTYQSSGDLFDFIILIGGLHHVYSCTQGVLNNLGKSLRPGGYFLVLNQLMITGLPGVFGSEFTNLTIFLIMIRNRALSIVILIVTSRTPVIVRLTRYIPAFLLMFFIIIRTLFLHLMSAGNFLSRAFLLSTDYFGQLG